MKYEITGSANTEIYRYNCFIFITFQSFESRGSAVQKVFQFTIHPSYFILIRYISFAFYLVFSLFYKSPPNKKFGIICGGHGESRHPLVFPRYTVAILLWALRELRALGIVGRSVNWLTAKRLCSL